MGKPNDKTLHSIRTAVVAIVSTMLCSCGGNVGGELGKESTGFFSRLFDPDSYKLYRIDITQGNILEPSKVAQVKAGMSKEQVVYLLGKPILPTAFHDDRWDYVYYNNVLREKIELYRLILIFDGNRIERLKKTKNLAANKNQETKK